MSHKYACVESMTRFTLPKGFTLRIWRDQTQEPLAIRWSNEDLYQTFLQWCKEEDACEEDLLRRFAAMERVNAVEMVNGMGNGTVVYPRWP